MSEQKFGIREISEIKFVNRTTGEEIKDIRDIKPIEKKFNPDTPILELVKMSSPSYEMANYPLIRKYGYDTFGSICEAWYWKDDLNNATDEELWKIYALIKADESATYEYWYDKEVYEFRKYKKENH